MKLMTFDIGGTEIKYALMDDNYNIYQKGFVPTPHDTFEHFSDEIYRIYEKYAEETEGIAMSLPGIIDVDNGVVLGSGALRYNWGRPVGPQLSEKCGCPVVLENDGKAAAQAELTVGSLQGCTNAAVFIIGTGVGGGIIVNKEVIRGIHSKAGEFSFINADPNMFDNFDGFVGNACSTTGLLNMYKRIKGTDETIDGREFFRRLPHDEAADKALDILACNIAKQIYNLFWLLDVEKVAIGGGISRQPAVTERINARFMDLYTIHPLPKIIENMNVEIVPAAFSNDANLIGAFISYMKKRH
ncbi:MAG: ROK family protein [Erysipelotrichaceae bacterium]|nr:ROK family protein [Erysipelotrichaceae bacterium]